MKKTIQGRCLRKLILKNSLRKGRIKVGIKGAVVPRDSYFKCNPTEWNSLSLLPSSISCFLLGNRLYVTMRQICGNIIHHGQSSCSPWQVAFKGSVLVTDRSASRPLKEVLGQTSSCWKIGRKYKNYMCIQGLGSWGTETTLYFGVEPYTYVEFYTLCFCYLMKNLW